MMLFSARHFASFRGGRTEVQAFSAVRLHHLPYVFFLILRVCPR